MPKFSKMSFMMLFLGIRLEQTLERLRGVDKVLLTIETCSFREGRWYMEVKMKI